MSIGQGVPPPATLLFNCLIRGMMLILNRPPANTEMMKSNMRLRVKRQVKAEKNYGTLRNYNFIPIGLL